jgi:ABC-type multidrug transport system fused ATPase/permease subunit
VFRDVLFGYQPGRPVLVGIDLGVPAGGRVALVGLSGSGKTTTVKLIPRLYDVWSGSVEIDGVDTRAFPLDVLRRNVSMVLQDAVLFEGTIRDNIALGRPEANDADIIEAARRAHIDSTITAMPDGYASEVREHGKNLSSGQRQRIAIARAILRDAPILILDEPTANLDVEAEVEVMHAIDTLIGGRTVITISHRLSTLGHVDEIVVLSEGRIAERGTYRQLKRRKGIFRWMLDEQHRYSPERIDAAARATPARGQRRDVHAASRTERR